MKNIFKKRRNLSSISNIISLSLVLFVVGILSLVLINANKVSDKMKESIVFSIMLYDSTDDTSKEMMLNQRAVFENYLDGSDYFLNIQFIDKEIAYKELQEDMGEDFSSILKINPLLDSYDAYVKAEFVNPNGLKKIEDFASFFSNQKKTINIFLTSDLQNNYLNSFIKSTSNSSDKLFLYLNKNNKLISLDLSEKYEISSYNYLDQLNDTKKIDYSIEFL